MADNRPFCETRDAPAPGSHNIRGGGVTRTGAPQSKKLRASRCPGVTTDYLLGGSEDNSLRADIEAQELLDMFRRVQKLPEDKKRSVKDFLEAYLFRERVREDIALRRGTRAGLQRDWCKKRSDHVC